MVPLGRRTHKRLAEAKIGIRDVFLKFNASTYHVLNIQNTPTTIFRSSDLFIFPKPSLLLVGFWTVQVLSEYMILSPSKLNESILTHTHF